MPAFIALLVAAAVGGSAGPSFAASVDPLLLPLFAGQPGPAELDQAPVGILSKPQEASDPSVAVTLRLSGAVADLNGFDLRIGSVLGDLVTAEVPVSQLSTLAVHPAIRSIQASRPLVPLLDVSVPRTFANLVHARVPNTVPIEWTGHTGRGVLIGIIDSGLDLNHADFRRPDGTTRVLAIWDQSSGTGAGRPPFGFSYGVECVAAQINTRECTEVDSEGHGTHVAGIAAGNGSATDRGQSSYRYIGMAPEADLLIVKLSPKTSNRVIDGLAYLQSKARAAGKPIVVNLSFGTSLGGHDGTSDFEHAIDLFTGPPEDPGMFSPGAVVVVAAGNSGRTKTHASGCFGPVGNCIDAPPIAGTTASIGFNVPGGATSLALDLWYTGGAILSVAVTSPCETTPGVSPAPDGTVVKHSSACGDITVTAVRQDPRSGDGESVIVLGGKPALRDGTWALSITAESLPTGPTRFDVWSSSLNNSSPATFLVQGPEDELGEKYTIEIPATANEAISVVHYVTRTRWTSINQRQPSYYDPNTGVGEIENTIGTAASRGPRRRCSVAEACSPVPKPDLAAPGLGIFSSLSSKTDPTPFEVIDASGTLVASITDRIEPDGRHWIFEGSSMAAPHVTGAVALLLQINPQLTARDIKDLLRATTFQPAPLPAETWGAGALNAKAAADRVHADRNPLPQAPQGLEVVSVGRGRVRLQWTPNPDLDLRGYLVYRKPAGVTTSPSLLTAAPVNATTFEDRFSLTDETPYLYTVTAVDIGPTNALVVDRESPPSNEARGTPTAGDGSVGFCFIATAAYGTPWHPHVVSLREFRDRRLRPFLVGRAMIATYERVSPPIARVIARHENLRGMTRVALTPLVLAVEHPRPTSIAALSLAGLAFGMIRWRLATARTRRASR